MDIVARAKGLLMDPQKEWRVIAEEPADVAGLFKNYVVILSALPAVAGLLGALIMGMGRISIVSLLVSAVLGYILALVGIFVLAKIIEMLAPRFGGPPDSIAALKLAAYAPTASWVGGIALIIPWIGWIPALLGGLYSLYLFYIGTPTVIRIPPSRVMPFAISVVVVAILVNILIGVVIGIIV